MAAVTVPSLSVTYNPTNGYTRSNELGMRPMQERAWEKRGEQYLLIKSPPASGKSRALMFIALDKLRNQGIRQAIVVVAGTDHWCELRGCGADQQRVLGGLGGPAQVEPLQCARHRRRQGQCREGVSGR